MRRNDRQTVLFAMLVSIAFACTSTKNTIAHHPGHIWTFTYLKATANQRANLKTFLEKNWFVMDSIAVTEKLIGKYELYENKETANAEWDYIVAVEYLTPSGYDDIAPKFEALRAKHITVKINGLDFRDLGKVVKSETLSKHTKPFP